MGAACPTCSPRSTKPRSELTRRSRSTSTSPRSSVSGGQLAGFARQAGLDAGVPTCPAWTVGKLVAHQAMVHRWAAAHVRGDDPDAVPDRDPDARDSVPTSLRYYDEGLGRSRRCSSRCAARSRGDDVPQGRARAARVLGPPASARDDDPHGRRAGGVARAGAVDRRGGHLAAFAADGLDELLRGFFTRGKSKLFDGKPFVVVVAPDDVERRWVLRVDERLSVDAGDDDVDDADARLSGSAAALYLALWNRGDEIDVRGRPDVLDRWHETQRVTWS